MRIKIIKFTPYPKEDPTGYAVGFDVVLPNGRGFYIDTAIPFDELETESTDEEITAKAYNKLKERIDARAEELNEKRSIIGSDFLVDPPEDDTPEVPPEEDPENEQIEE